MDSNVPSVSNSDQPTASKYEPTINLPASVTTRIKLLGCLANTPSDNKSSPR